MSKKLSKYLNNVHVDPRFLGLAGNLTSFPNRQAAARLDMFAGHLAQALIVDGCEQPMIFTGAESLISEFTSNSARLEEDIRIIAIIPKIMMINDVTMFENPELYVIYRGLETNTMNYFVIRNFTKCAGAHGYRNIKTPEYYQLVEGNVVEKDTLFYHSPAIDGEMYRLGVNANICYSTDQATFEDAFRISESLANKLSSTCVESYTIDLEPNKHAVGIYSDENFKFFPDIGDTVNDDGILCAFRNTAAFSVINDLRLSNLKKMAMYDEKIWSKPGARVIDVEVYLSGKYKVPKLMNDQLLKYHREGIRFHKAIYNTYIDNVDVPMHPKMNTLVTRAISFLLAEGHVIKDCPVRRGVRLREKKKELNARLVITVAYDLETNLGFKLTGNDGAKGVVGVITPDDEMPVDEQGIRADLVIDLMGVLKRTNIVQLFEQFINRTSLFVKRHIQDMDTDAAYAYVLEYLEMVNPNYADLIRRTLDTRHKIEKYIKYCKDENIIIHIPPTMELTPDRIIEIADKYGSRGSRITFTVTKHDGTKIKETSIRPIMIGPKYIYLLFKRPMPSAASAYVNQFHAPVKPKAKNVEPIGRTPIRFGEDEFRMIMAAVGPEPLVRMKSLNSTTPEGKEKAIEQMISSPSPSSIGHISISDERLQDEDFILNMIKSQFNAIGVDIQKTKITKEEADALFRLIE